MWLHYICTESKLGPKLIRSLRLLKLGKGRSFYKWGGGGVYQNSTMRQTAFPRVLYRAYPKRCACRGQHFDWSVSSRHHRCARTTSIPPLPHMGGGCCAIGFLRALSGIRTCLAQVTVITQGRLGGSKTARDWHSPFRPAVFCRSLGAVQLTWDHLAQKSQALCGGVQLMNVVPEGPAFKAGWLERPTTKPWGNLCATNH